MHIAIDGHSLGILGGIERVVCNLASAMVQRGHQVTIFISEPLPKKPIYTFDEQVRFIIYTHGGRQKYIERFRRQILSCAPDICISPAADRRHFPWCAALWNSGIPFIVSEHSTPEDVESRIWNRSERLAVMAAADAIHVLRASCLPSLPEDLRVRAHVIPNAVMLPSLQRVHKNHCTIISMGRLDRDKQNHLLVEAFASLSPDFPQWRLEIWGTGPDQWRLKKQVRQLGMKDRVRICGLTTEPEKCYATADVVCHPSRHEAFPNTVIESMSAGIPVVGFASCPGVNELVRHGETGLLAPEMTSTSLAQALRTLLQNATLRKKWGIKVGNWRLPMPHTLCTTLGRGYWRLQSHTKVKPV